MEIIKHAISWFEIPVTNFDRAKKFYSAIFNYEMPETTMGSVRMGFLLYEQGKGVGGAICYGKDYEPSQKGTIPYLSAGSDLNNVLNRVENAGGKIVVPKTEIGENYGYFAYFIDPEGNKIGLHSMN